MDNRTIAAKVPLIEQLIKYSDAVVAFGLIIIIALLIIPLPTAVLDVLLTVNLSGALMILLLTMYITDALQFSVFPSLLLMATLFRLALNVSATRLILANGFAGNVIESFGGFVVSGNFVVGFIVFLILVIIQFLVITNGATRIAEVAARFTLDAMPGKQMSIDADLNAGLIDEQQARERRRQIEREADFYGAMDGASKFVKGDAILGIIIVFVIIVGGFIIGALQQGLDLMESLQKFMGLAVGNGLVTQIPALLISTATGIIVTRAASDSSLGKDLSTEMVTQPKVLWIAGGLLIAFGLVPGLPKLPFFVIGLIAITFAYVLGQGISDAEDKEEVEERDRQISEARSPENISSLLQIDPMELEIGYGLIPIVDPDQGGELLSRVSVIRRQIALELGLVVPPIRIRDNMQLPPNTYSIKIRTIEVAKGDLFLDRLLAMYASENETMDGIETTEPAFGLPAIWILPSQKEEAELKGFTVVDPSSVVATHLTELLRSHSHELLGRQEVQSLVDNIKATNPVVIDELIPNLATVGEVQKILQNLLRERVSIRDLITILETIADYIKVTKDIDVLTEHVRQAQARNICKNFITKDKKMPVIVLDPRIEQLITEGVQQTEQGSYIAIEPADVQKLNKSLLEQIEKASSLGYQPIVLTSPAVRLYFKRLSERNFPNLAVLSYNEITPDINVESVGMVNLD